MRKLAKALAALAQEEQDLVLPARELLLRLAVVRHIGVRRSFVILSKVSARYERVRPGAVIDLVAEAWRNLGAFRAAYGWLLGDLIAFARRRVLLVVGLNFLGVALQWAVVGAVLLFVGELTGEGGAFQVPLLSGLELPVDTSFDVVLLWGLGVLILVLVASLSTYGAEAVGFRTAQRYVDHSGQHLLRLALTATSSGGKASDFPTQRLQVALIRDQLMMLRALLVIQRSLRAVLMVLVAAVVLTLVNPVLTAVVAVVGTLFIGPYYLLNRRMVEAAAALESRNLSARLSIARTVEQATSREPNEAIRRRLLDSYASDPTINQRWAVLREIMLGGQRTSALMGAVIGTCLVAVVVAFSLLIASDDASWVAALTFIIGLNLASGAFVQLASFITAANRFLPHVQDFIRYRATFVEAVESTNAVSADTSPLPTVKTSRPVLAGSYTELCLTAETRLFCVAPGPVDRLNLHTLLFRLVEGSEMETRRLRAAAFFCGDHASLPSVTLKELLDRRALEALAELRLTDEVAALPKGDMTVLTAEVQEQLSPLLRYALAMLEGISQELLVLGWKPFARLSSDDRGRLLAVLEGHPVIFVTSGIPRKQPLEATHTAILTEHGIAGMGDAKWYQSVTASLPLVLQSQAPQRVGAGAAAGLLDLDES